MKQECKIMAVSVDRSQYIGVERSGKINYFNCKLWGFSIKFFNSESSNCDFEISS